MEQIFSIGQVGSRLGIQSYRIAYAIKTGHLPEAPFRFLDKRCFTELDIQRIAEFYRVELSDQPEKGA